MMKSTKRWMIFFLVLFHIQTKAQTFAWKSSLDTITASGFYTIPLSIDWLVHAKPDLSDIRIKDEDNKAVPYLIKKLPAESRPSFTSFPILKNATDSVSTIVDIDASGHHGTDHFSLVIANNAVERFTSLSGSDDGKRWFIIDEKLPLTNATGYATDHFVQELNFPFIRYRFLRLIINNRSTYPLQILNAGVYADSSRKESLSLYLHQGTNWSQKDSADGNTYVSVHNPQPYPVDRISMVLSGPKFYTRQVKAYSISNDGTKNPTGLSILRSGEDPAIWVRTEKTKDLLLVVENGDNPSLKINAVNTQCQVQELIAYLEKGKQYTLLGGNDSVAAPHYELASFRDSIPSQSPLLHHLAVLPNDNATVAHKTSNHNWWIWPAIIIALIVLTFLTYRLVADIKKAK